MSRRAVLILALLLLVVLPVGVFVAAGGGKGPSDVAIVREAMGSQIGANACDQQSGVVSCGIVGGAVCRYRVFTGSSARSVENGFTGPPAGVYVAVVGRCALHGRPDGGTVGYLTSAQN